MMAVAGQFTLVTPEEVAAILVTVSAIIGLWIWTRNRKNGQPVRFRLRTLLIAVAILPPVLAGLWWLCLREGVLGMLKIGIYSVGIAVWVQIAIRRTMGW